MILVDTNVLLRLAQPGHSSYPAALNALSQLRLDGRSLCLTPQVLYEFWAVATRPTEANGLGMTAAKAQEDVTKILSRFFLLKDEDGLFERWRALVVQHEVLGKKSHDARLVAAMQCHGVENLLTFNGDDFKRFADISVINAADFAAG